MLIFLAVLVLLEAGVAVSAISMYSYILRKNSRLLAKLEDRDSKLITISNEMLALEAPELLIDSDDEV